jgi:N-acyl-D-aspartate/D-glutamate deacylase
MHQLVIKNGTIVDGTGAPRFVGDIAIDGGHITAVGQVGPDAARTIDATGRIVTPGFVDIHTHYDGQATWDTTLAPSAWHGVTTVVFGNCGVGFAPVLPNRHDQLIKIMEGVEDIPGTALHEGLTWDWESFPQYLDKLASQQYIMDIGTQVPHNALRAHVMGDRGSNQPATPDDVKKMAALVREGIKAGAFGFSTSRTSHRDSEGRPVPSRYALEDELLEIGRVLSDLGTGLFEVGSAQPIPDDPDLPMKEAVWLKKFARETGRPITFTLTQQFGNPRHWKEMFRISKEAAEEGLKLQPQSLGRPVAALMGLTGRHPFEDTPTWQAELADLSLAEKLERLSTPQMRERLLEEAKGLPARTGGLIGFGNWAHSFLLGGQADAPDYEPVRERSIRGIAESEGKTEVEAFYDALLELDGRQLILRTVSNYLEGNLDVVREMLTDPICHIGLSDAGAHCRAICDASLPTTMLTHWARDRKRGAKLPLEFVVKKQSYDTATLFGIYDRGVLKPGFRADLNIIDFENLKLEMPEMVADLPAGGSRFMQRAQGYDYTIVKGEVTIEKGMLTGARPGRLMRGEQHLTYMYRQSAKVANVIEV